MADLVLDASSFVELLLQTAIGRRVAARLQDHALHAPAHLDAEILSALGRLCRAGEVAEEDAATRLDVCADAPIERHPLPPLLTGAWNRRQNVRLADALYVELAEQLQATLLSRQTKAWPPKLAT